MVTGFYDAVSPATAGNTSVTIPVVDSGGAFYNLRSFGAKCDGDSSTPTDDTAAVVNAIASIPEGSTLVIPALTKITSPITINRPISVKGEGVHPASWPSSPTPPRRR